MRMQKERKRKNRQLPEKTFCRQEKVTEERGCFGGISVVNKMLYIIKLKILDSFIETVPLFAQKFFQTKLIYFSC